MPRKLTEEVLTRIREVEIARRAIPTRAQLARELGVSKSSIDQTAKKLHSVAAPTTALNVPRGTLAKLQHHRIELGLTKP